MSLLCGTDEPQTFVLHGGEAVATPTFQLGGAGSTPGRDI